MFVEDNETVNIKLYFRKDGRSYEVYHEHQFNNADIKTSDRAQFQILNVTMKELNWGLHNELQEAAVVDLGNGATRFDYRKFKESKLFKTITAWDAKDKNGNPVPVNAESIKKLHEDIGEAIVRAYDDKSYLGEEAEKK